MLTGSARCRSTLQPMACPSQGRQTATGTRCCSDLCGKLTLLQEWRLSRCSARSCRPAPDALHLFETQAIAAGRLAVKKIKTRWGQAGVPV